MHVSTRPFWHFITRGSTAILLGVLVYTTILAPAYAQDQDVRRNRPTVEDGSPQEPISVDWEATPLLEVVNSLGALTGRNFEIPQSLNKSIEVNIISTHDIPPEMAYELLEAILNSHGFALVETLKGNLVKIVQRAGASAPGQFSPEKLPIHDNTGKAHLGYDNFAIHIIQLEYVQAQEASEILKKVGSPSVDVTVFQNTNMLLIIDTADGFRNMFKVLETIDIPGYEIQLEIFLLEYTRAEALADQLNQVLGEGAQQGSARPGQAPRTVQPRNPRTSAVPGQRATTIVGSGEETLRMVPDERLNSLIVVATFSMMEQVKYMISRLDTPTPFESNNLHYVPLLHSDALEVEGVLSGLTSGTGVRDDANASANTGEILLFNKEVTISAYEENNALVIVASPLDFKILNDFIKKLDTPRKQVLVESLIMEVTLGTAFELNVEAAALSASDHFALSNVANIANAIAGGPAALAGPGGTFGLLDGTTTVTMGDTTTEIANVPFLIKSLESITDVEILSRPNLLMKDNTEGSLKVGQDIPIPTSQSDINPSSGFVSRNSIARRDVGIDLAVTPQINEGDYVSLEIRVESSSAVDSTVGIDANATGATIAQSIVETEVVLKNGQTGIIGGLIREGQNRGVAQVPILGDIPFIGALFRGRKHGRDRQNLVVLVTPHIINRDEDMNDITQKSMDQFYRYNLDAIFENGFVKKIKAKRRLRNQHRPSDNLKKQFTDIDTSEEIEIMEDNTDQDTR